MPSLALTTVTRPFPPLGPLALGVLVALAAGCAASSQAMQRASTGQPLAPPPANHATVVFLRTSAFGGSATFELFDGKKRFLGDSLPRAHFEVSLPPGTHWFYASAENTAMMRAQLEAGRRYYVNVRPYIGVWGARVELISLARSHRDWPLRARLISQTQRMVAVPGKGQAALNERAEELDEEMRAAGEAFQRASEGWRNARSLFADDGEAIARPPTRRDPAPATTPEEPATPPPTVVPSTDGLQAAPPIEASTSTAAAPLAAPLPPAPEPATEPAATSPTP